MIEERFVIGEKICGGTCGAPRFRLRSGCGAWAPAGAVYAGVQRDSGGIQNRLGACAFMSLYLGVLGLSSLPIWRAERLLFVRRAPNTRIRLIPPGSTPSSVPPSARRSAIWQSGSREPFSARASSVSEQSLLNFFVHQTGPRLFCRPAGMHHSIHSQIT